MWLNIVSKIKRRIKLLFTESKRESRTKTETFRDVRNLDIDMVYAKENDILT